jgi:hypothetical protein
MFESSSSRRLGCLGLGLTAAHSVAGKPLTLVLPQGTFAFDGQALIPMGQPGLEGLSEIRVPGRYGFVGSLFRRDASLEETLGLCGCAPLKIDLDGKAIPGGWRPGYFWNVGAVLHYRNDRYPLAWGSSNIKPFITRDSPGDFSALFALMPQAEASKAGLTIVHQGVSYRTQDPNFHIPGVCVAVMTDQLERNLSRSEILWNETYNQLTESLRSGAASLIGAVLESDYRFSPTMRACQPAVQWAYDQLRSRADGEDVQGASWLATEARLRTHPTPEIMISLAAEQVRLGKTRKAEDFHLAAIELVVDKFRRSARSRDLANNLPVWAPLLRELIDKLGESDRKVALREFLAMVEPGQQAEKLSVEQQIQQHRLKGESLEAVQLLAEWKERPYDFSYDVPAELWLAVPRTEEALAYLLRNEESLDLDQALSKPWPSYRKRDLELLADTLEYRDDARALRARQLRIDIAEGVEMRYLTSLEMCRHARAKGKMAYWIKARASASFLSMARGMSTVELLDKDHPLIGDILQGNAAVPQDVDALLLPLLDKLGCYGDVLPYLIGRLAHRLRLKGEYLKAEQLLARCYTLRCMDRALGNF